MTAQQTTTIEQLIAKWDSPDGHPYKGQLIDWKAYLKNPDSISCFCAQGQALHLVGGMSPEKIFAMEQEDADRETAKLLGISRTHAVLLRNTNDSVDGAPAIVLTHPERVIGDQAQTILAFWRYMDRMTAKQWAAAWYADRDAAGDAAWYAARAAAWDAARDAAWVAAWNAVRVNAWDGVTAAARAASAEIQGAAIMRKNGTPFFFLPLFGFADPEAVLAADEVAG